MTLIGYWPSNESQSATEAKDYSGNENHGTIKDGGDSTVPGATGILGQNAYQFDGNNDYLEISDSSELRGLDRLTISVWINLQSKSDYDGMLDKSNIDNTNTDRIYRMFLDDSADQKIGFGVDTGSGWTAVFSDNAIPTNEWRHITGVYDGSKLYIYVNGRKQNDTATVSGTLIDASTELAIGALQPRSSAPRMMEGNITELRIYKRALTTSEVQYLYTTSKRGRQTTSTKNS